MIGCAPRIYEMSEKEYKIFRGYFSIGYTTALTFTLTGLAGIVASTALAHFNGPENSQLTKEIIGSSVPLLAVGGFLSLYLKLDHYIDQSFDEVNKKK